MNDLNVFSPNTVLPQASQQYSKVTSESESQRAIASVQASVIMAKRFPRDQREAMARIIQACTRPSFAKEALYTYSKGGTDISGASVKLARVIAQSWGNLKYGMRELSHQDGMVTIQAFAWDMETNTEETREFQLALKRDTKKGSYKIEDSREIYELAANYGQRRVRACIIDLIPDDVVKEAIDQCNKTLTTHFEVTNESIKAMLDGFNKLGVTKTMVQKRIQRNIESITPALMVNLHNIYNSLSDGMSQVSDWFEVDIQAVAPSTQSATDAVKAKLAAKQTTAVKQSLTPQDNVLPEKQDYEIAADNHPLPTNLVHASDEPPLPLDAPIPFAHEGR